MAQANRRAEPAAEGWAGAAQDTANNAAQKVSEGASYVQDKLGAANEAVRDYTGKPLDEWTRDLKAFMRERPLLGAAAMIVAGYMAARIFAAALRPR